MFINCMRTGCEAIAIYRGCCHRHYRHTQSRVRRGLITWDEAEKQGLVKPFIRGKDGQLNKRSKESA